MSAPAPALSHTTVQWNALTSHVNQWFYKPDLMALDIALTASFAHYVTQADPIWLFVIGPSSSGKTSIIINALRDLPNSHIMGDITTKTFISHYGGKNAKQDAGLLHRIGSSGLMLFKDFTTVISKREDDKKEIAAQLREIYDGEWKRDTGVDGRAIWKGKITTIAVCTPALERSWGMMRELGERFVSVRWPRIGGITMARAAAKQRGHEADISRITAELGRKLFDSLPRHSPLPLNDELGERTAALSEIICNLRANVTRDSARSREIIDIPNVEEPGRINKSLEVLATTHAQLWHRAPTLDDFALVERVGLDCVSSGRRAIFDCLRNAHGAKLCRAEITKTTSLPASTVEWITEELQALSVVEITQTSTGDQEYKFTEQIANYMQTAFDK